MGGGSGIDYIILLSQGGNWVLTTVDYGGGKVVKIPKKSTLLLNAYYIQKCVKFKAYLPNTYSILMQIIIDLQIVKHKVTRRVLPLLSKIFFVCGH